MGRLASSLVSVHTMPVASPAHTVVMIKMSPDIAECPRAVGQGVANLPPAGIIDRYTILI